MPLTVKQIEAATFGRSKERLGDGSGLFLRLYPSGSKIFQVLLPAEAGIARRVWVSVGDFPATTLKEARERASWARLQSARGWSAERIRAAIKCDLEDVEVRSSEGSSRHALEAPAERQGRRKPKAVAVAAPKSTFADVAQLWFQQKSQGLSNGKHIAQNWTTLQTYVLPVLGRRPVDEITTIDIVECLRPIWRDKHETARRTLARTREVFELARLKHGLSGNPAQFDPVIAYGRVQRKTKHFGSLSWERMPEFWTWLCGVPCDEVTRQMAMLIVLTAKRTGEARYARFDEIDAEMATWTTPAEKMKMRQEHRVPLSHQALIVHENLRCLNGERDFLFAKARTKSGVLSENTVLKLVQRFDPEITGHGFRATFKGWARSQRRYQKDAIEFALAHGLPPLEAAYFREDLLEERRPLMQDWADFVGGGSGVRKIADGGQ